MDAGAAVRRARSRGTARAHPDGMGAGQFTELMAWQRARELKNAVYALTARPAVTRDLRFCGQIRDSASSACSNIAEGFGRFSHREFGQFLVIARGSLMETRNHLQDGADRGYISRQELESLLALSSHALAATTALLRYLQQHPAPHVAPRT